MNPPVPTQGPVNLTKVDFWRKTQKEKCAILAKKLTKNRTDGSNTRPEIADMPLATRTPSAALGLRGYSKVDTLRLWYKPVNFGATIDSGLVDPGSGAARAEDAEGTPTQSHISPSVLVYQNNKAFTFSRDDKYALRSHAHAIRVTRVERPF
jgi:hypothetical protein